MTRRWKMIGAYRARAIGSPWASLTKRLQKSGGAAARGFFEPELRQAGKDAGTAAGKQLLPWLAAGIASLGFALAVALKHRTYPQYEEKH
jgi:hypothetical protein